jgi:3-phosphoshikimate 1-carboxyvinyltransferase
MRGTIQWNPKRGYTFDASDIQVKGSSLEGIHITPALAQTMITELPIVGAIAASARGETILREPEKTIGIGREAYKTLKSALEKLGAHVGEYREGLVVKGPREMKGTTVQSNGIPGIALALALAGINASGCTEITDYDPQSYPLYLFLNEGIKALAQR